MTHKKILIVEDDQDIREVLAELLSGEGFDVSLGENGKVGLDLLNSSSVLPDLILLDLRMPVMDGLEFCAQKKANPKFENIPVILMTADREVLEKRHNANVQAYLKKPLDFYKILEIIQQFPAPVAN